MNLTVLRNSFCEFPWPDDLGWNFEAIRYGDSKALTLSPRKNIVHALILVWDRTGKDLETTHTMHWSRLARTPQGFPPGTIRETIESTGMYRHWIGASLRMGNTHTHYELMSTNDDTVVYVRRTTLHPCSLDLVRELSMIRVEAPGSWLVGAELTRVSL